VRSRGPRGFAVFRAPQVSPCWTLCLNAVVSGVLSSFPARPLSQVPLECYFRLRYTQPTSVFSLGCFQVPARPHWLHPSPGSSLSRRHDPCVLPVHTCDLLRCHGSLLGYSASFHFVAHGCIELQAAPPCRTRNPCGRPPDSEFLAVSALPPSDSHLLRGDHFLHHFFYPFVVETTSGRQLLLRALVVCSAPYLHVFQRGPLVRLGLHGAVLIGCSTRPWC